MKICCTCKTYKTIDQFNIQRSQPDGHQAFCRDCQKKRFNHYYAVNQCDIRKRVRTKRKTALQEGRKLVAAYLKKHPCLDCGCTDIRVLEFDHKNGDLKRDGVMALVNKGCCIKTISLEIAKCEIRCSNCHTIKTYQRMGGSWHDNFH